MSDEMTGPYVSPTPPPSGARFAPGELLAGRYRVVAPLGKGGMGEVYRADDLTLGQPVALKFLPPHLASDPDRLARFKKEVATARRVSHPNACRVYDIGAHDGQPFLAMEYIDGEDLASLLRRVGRLLEEKGVAIARQLGLALAAVHEQGLLHRDLKPQNVMLDGRGQVRLTDFGLAVLAGEAADVQSGTPAYQAPEQLRGESVSVQSDLFALGLVLYEVFTGHRAFPASTRDELARAYESGPPSKPSSHVSGLNPGVERVVLRCLEREPAARPRSAYEVVAGLPGGDPLAAALAAGQTPSPHMVAEGGEVGAIRPWLGAVLVALVVAGLVAITVLNERASLLHFVPRPQPPEELARRARQRLADLGYPDRPADSAWHFRVALDYLHYISDTDPSPGRWAALGGGRPAALYFFYREAAEPLAPALLATAPYAGLVETNNPPPTQPGMASVRLDGQGRLLGLLVVPTAGGGAAEPAAEWKPLLAAAGLPDDMAEGELRWLPPCACDRRAAWDGAFPERPDLAIHVEAAAFRGKPVFFRVGGAWTAVEGRPQETNAPGRVGSVVVAVMVLTLFATMALVALRNLRLGRGDRRGAAVLGGAIVGGGVAAWVLGGHHAGTVIGETVGLQATLGEFGLYGLISALVYLAIEPAMRRRWPWRLTAWSRVLAGRWRDPLVGRDLLVGLVSGLGLVLLVQAQLLVPEALGRPSPYPDAGNLGVPGPFSPRLVLLQIPVVCLFAAPVAFALVFLLVLLLRYERLAWAGMVVLLTLSRVAGDAPPSLLDGAIVTLNSVLFIGLQVFLIARFGLWAFAASFLASRVVAATPLTWDVSAWYFWQGLLGPGVVAVLAVYGFVTATRGQRLFKGGFFGDE